MMNITKLKIWPELKALGFVPIKYRGRGGKIVSIGAALRVQGTKQDGTPVDPAIYRDLIEIEPFGFSSQNGKNYHITGAVNTPFTQEFFRYNEIGQKESFFDTVDRINEFYTARSILKTVQLMLK